MAVLSGSPRWQSSVAVLSGSPYRQSLYRQSLEAAVYRGSTTDCHQGTDQVMMVDVFVIRLISC